jgi:hypothetical protein
MPFYAENSKFPITLPNIFHIFFRIPEELPNIFRSFPSISKISLNLLNSIPPIILNSPENLYKYPEIHSQILFWELTNYFSPIY